MQRRNEYYYFSIVSFNVYSQVETPGNDAVLYRWINNKNTKNAHEGGLVQNGTYVEISVYIAPTAKVLGSVSVTGNARIYGNAIVQGQASVEGNARIYGNAIVEGNAIVTDKATVFGDAIVSGDAVISGNARIAGHSRIKSGNITAGFINKPRSLAEIKAEKDAAAAALKKLAEEKTIFETVSKPLDEKTDAIVKKMNAFKALNKAAGNERLNYHFEKQNACAIMLVRSAICHAKKLWDGTEVRSKVLWNPCRAEHYVTNITGNHFGAIEFSGSYIGGSGSSCFSDNFRIIYQDGNKSVSGYEELLSTLQKHKAEARELFLEIPELFQKKLK